MLNKFPLQNEKAWESCYCPFHDTEALALPKQSERTTQKAHAWVYIIPCMSLMSIYNYTTKPTAWYNIPTVNIYSCHVL